MIRTPDDFARPPIPVPEGSLPPMEPRLPVRCAPEHRLMNQTELADWLTVARDFVKDAALAGLPLVGGRISPADARAWLAAHPGFRAEARRIRAERRQATLAQ